MNTPGNQVASDRLSVSMPLRRARRELTALERDTFRRIADTLIPSAADNPSGSALQGFDALIHQALAILDSKFERIVANLAELAPVPPEALWERLRGMNDSRPDDFYWLSTVVVGAYVYSPEIKDRLKYPTPHRNPPDLFDVAEELSSGIVDPVIERGPIYVTDGGSA